MTETEITPDTSSFRGRLRAWLETDRVRNAILGIIIFNAITLGLGTSDRVEASFGNALYVIDRTVLAIFVFELLLKFFA